MKQTLWKCDRCGKAFTKEIPRLCIVESTNGFARSESADICRGCLQMLRSFMTRDISYDVIMGLYKEDNE